MKGFKLDIEKAAVENTDFRRALYTSTYSQLVLMSLRPLEEIGLEVHTGNDQFFRVEKGFGQCVIDGNEDELSDGDQSWSRQVPNTTLSISQTRTI